MDLILSKPIIVSQFVSSKIIDINYKSGERCIFKFDSSGANVDITYISPKREVKLIHKNLDKNESSDIEIPYLSNKIKYAREQVFGE